MIDDTPFILNSSSISDLLVSNPEFLEASVLSEEDKERASEELDSFVLLMAQVLPEVSSKSSSEAEPLPENDVSVKLNELIKDPINSNEVDKIITDYELPQSEEELDGLKEMDTLDERTAIILNNNVAMTWIQSQGFEPPQSVSAEIELQNEGKKNPAALPLQAKSLPQKQEELNKEKSTAFFSEEVTPEEQNTLSGLKEEVLLAARSLVAGMTEDSSNILDTMPVITEGEPQIDSFFLDHSMAKQNMSMPNLVPSAEYEAKANPPSSTLSIPVDINSSEWSDTFSEHIIWMSQQGIKSAVIKLHPEELGPLEISVKVIKDSATVTIASHSGQVREIVDQSLPRLRDMMSEQGLNLVDVSVDSESNSRQFTERQQHVEEAVHVDADTEIQIQTTAISKNSPKGLVDYFA